MCTCVVYACVHVYRYNTYTYKVNGVCTLFCVRAYERIHRLFERSVGQIHVIKRENYPMHVSNQVQSFECFVFSVLVNSGAVYFRVRANKINSMASSMFSVLFLRGEYNSTVQEIICRVSQSSS